ncbi:MAG: hypothetical protein LBE89_06375 [Helicobacteraceae bacterium]|nr:hypothetical protein [Helicobacteraceae bacterium]
MGALGAAAAYQLAEAAKTAPQFAALTPKWLLQMLEFKGLETGVYRVNKVAENEMPPDILSGKAFRDGAIPQGFIDYDAKPREYRLNSISVIVNVDTKISDIYGFPYDQTEEQIGLAIESLQEFQESMIINGDEYGLLKNATQRIQAKAGVPTPDDLDELMTKVWKEPSFFLAHPLAIAAFSRECTRRGLPLETANAAEGTFVAWRGVPIVPTDKAFVDGVKNPKGGGKTNIILVRTGEAKRGVIGLYQADTPNERSKGISVRLRGIDDNAIASYIISVYCAVAALADDSFAVLENVDVSRY